MKTQATYDFDNDQRLAVGIATTGNFVLASQKQCREWMENVVDTQAAVLGVMVAKKRNEIADLIRGESDGG